MGCCKVCGGCTVFFVACIAVLAGLYHAGKLSTLWPYAGQFMDQHGNAAASGLSPALYAGKIWRYEYSMLPSLKGRVALVTGANSGVGFSTALHLARQGAKVLVGCRSKTKCSEAVDKIKSNFTAAIVEPAIMDVSSLASVRSFGEAFLATSKQLDILVLNAGIGTSSSKRSADDIEPVFATNHVGHQLLYTLLENLLLASGTKTGDARVVVVSSLLHSVSYDDGVALSRAELNARWDAHLADPDDHAKDKAYPQSKLANVLFAQEAARRMACKPVFVNSVNPGAVSTEIWDNGAREREKAGMKRPWFWDFIDYFKESMWTPDDGALTQIYLAAATDVKDRDIRGRYFHPQAVETQPCGRFARNLKLQQDLWRFTEELIAGRG